MITVFLEMTGFMDTFEHTHALSEMETKGHRGVHKYLFQNSHVIDRLCRDGVEIRIMSYNIDAVKNTSRNRRKEHASRIPAVKIAVLATKGDKTYPMTQALVTEIIGSDNLCEIEDESYGWLEAEYRHDNISMLAYFFKGVQETGDPILMVERMSSKIMKEDRSKGIVVTKFVSVPKDPTKVMASIAISATATPVLTAEQQPAIITDLGDSKWFAIVSLNGGLLRQSWSLERSGGSCRKGNELFVV